MFAFSAAVYARKIAFLLLTHQQSLHVKIIPMLHQKESCKTAPFDDAFALLKMQNFIQPFVAAMLRKKIKKNVMMPVS